MATRRKLPAVTPASVRPPPVLPAALKLRLRLSKRELTTIKRVWRSTPPAFSRN